MKNNLLAIKNLTVQYVADETVFHAVNGIDLTIAEGETLGLVGETGAGKTTTALSVLRVLPERTGRILSGEILFHRAGRAEPMDLLKAEREEMHELRGSHIAMIFQDPMTSLNPVLTVATQLREMYELHQPQLSRDEMDTKVDEMLELVGINRSRKNEYPFQFSGGMKQRIVIAMALACSPQLILADEPTTALDVTIQAQVLKLMVDLKKKINTSMLLITHDLGVVAQVCDKVAIMYAGEIMERGTVEDIFDSPQKHPYTQGLFGSIPNLKVKSTRLAPISGLMPDPTNLPEGCPFAPRCPHCLEVCRQEKPEAHNTGTHQITCHLFALGHEAGRQAGRE